MARYLSDWLVEGVKVAANDETDQLEVFSHPADETDAQQKAFMQTDH